MEPTNIAMEINIQDSGWQIRKMEKVPIGTKLQVMFMKVNGVII